MLKIDKILTATDDLTDLFGIKLAYVSVDKIRSYCACCITYFGWKKPHMTNIVLVISHQ